MTVTDVVPGRTAAISPRAIGVAAGRELRLARDDLGWTRRHAANRVPGLTPHCLEKYELGLVMCPLAQLIRLCRSMSVPAPDLLELVMQRTPVDLHMITLHVDLPAVALDHRSPRMVRGWANKLWHHGTHQRGVVRVPQQTVGWLARSANMQPELLLTYLAGKGPHSIRGSKTIHDRVEPEQHPPVTIGLTKEVVRKALGAELRALRTDRKWTGVDVGSRLPGLARAGSWYGYEYGKVHCSIARLIEIGRIFAIPPPVLVRRTLIRLDRANPGLGLAENPIAVLIDSETGDRGGDGHQAAVPTPSRQP